MRSSPNEKCSHVVSWTRDITAELTAHSQICSPIDSNYLSEWHSLQLQRRGNAGRAWGPQFFVNRGQPQSLCESLDQQTITAYAMLATPSQNPHIPVTLDQTTFAMSHPFLFSVSGTFPCPGAGFFFVFAANMYRPVGNASS